MRMSHITYPVKGNPFVSSAPSYKHFKVIEHTPTKLSYRILTRTHDIPYCDTFGVEEQWDLSSPKADSKCAIIKCQIGPNWYKSTMMKGIILKTQKAETISNTQNWFEKVKERGHLFVEKKRPAKADTKKKKGKQGKYETSDKLHKKKEKAAQPAPVPVQVTYEQPKKKERPARPPAESNFEMVQNFGLDIWEGLYDTYESEPVKFILGCTLFLVLWCMWRLGSIQN